MKNPFIVAALLMADMKNAFAEHRARGMLSGDIAVETGVWSATHRTSHRTVAQAKREAVKVRNRQRNKR